MLDHIGLAVSDIDRSRAFYTAALAPLGYRLIHELTTDQTESAGTAVMFGIGGEVDFVIADNERPGEGNHVAFRAETREAVRAFHSAALKAGGKDNGAPGPRPQYGETYYAAFVHDPDGFNVETVCHAEGE